MPATFRIDDCSVNTDLGSLGLKVRLLRERVPGCQFIFAISPLVYTMHDTATPERVFPAHWKPRSDHRVFYDVNRCGLPDLRDLLATGDRLATHGLVHVDHRLLSREAQELSIVVSSRLANAYLFVPPFNYWNADTEAICCDYNLVLVKYEDGWQHLHHAPWTANTRYYFHPHDTTLADLEAWLR